MFPSPVGLTQDFSCCRTMKGLTREYAIPHLIDIQQQMNPDNRVSSSKADILCITCTRLYCSLTYLMELTEACSSREWCGWQRWQISAILVLCQVDGWNLSSQVAHQLFHSLVITLHVHQYLELRLPPVGGSGFDMQHIYSEFLRII